MAILKKSVDARFCREWAFFNLIVVIKFFFNNIMTIHLSIYN